MADAFFVLTLFRITFVLRRGQDEDAQVKNEMLWFVSPRPHLLTANRSYFSFTLSRLTRVSRLVQNAKAGILLKTLACSGRTVLATDPV